MEVVHTNEAAPSDNWLGNWWRNKYCPSWIPEVGLWESLGLNFMTKKLGWAYCYWCKMEIVYFMPKFSRLRAICYLPIPRIPPLSPQNNLKACIFLLYPEQTVAIIPRMLTMEVVSPEGVATMDFSVAETIAAEVMAGAVGEIGSKTFSSLFL